MDNIEIRVWQESDIKAVTQIWNDILVTGVAFPGEKLSSENDMREMLKQQSIAVCASVNGEIAGFFIIHPNNIGRCSHVANASYGVSDKFKGHGIGTQLVEESLNVAKELGFLGIQFNAVVAGNRTALGVYEKFGFERVGTIPGGFRLSGGTYSDMHILYRSL